MPAWSAKLSSSVWWRSPKALGAVEKAEITPMIWPPTRSGTLRSERSPSFSSTSRRAERGSWRRSSERTARPEEAATPMIPSPTRTERFRHSGVRKPWAAACSIGVRSGLSSPMPQPVLPMSAVTERLIVSSTEGRSSRAVMSWLVRLSAASSSARCGRLRVQARVLDGGGERPRHLGEHLDVGVGEGAPAPGG